MKRENKSKHFWKKIFVFQTYISFINILSIIFINYFKYIDQTSAKNLTCCCYLKITQKLAFIRGQIPCLITWYSTIWVYTSKIGFYDSWFVFDKFHLAHVNILERVIPNNGKTLKISQCYSFLAGFYTTHGLGNFLRKL